MLEHIPDVGAALNEVDQVGGSIDEQEASRK